MKPMPELNSEAIDFGAPSECFAPFSLSLEKR
jgi:hypothetical protein